MVYGTIYTTAAYISALRREAYSKGHDAGSLLSIAHAVSQAAACDGTRITTTATGQEKVPTHNLFIKTKTEQTIFYLICLI